MNILQVGAGNFGTRHLEAWKRLGLVDHLWVAECQEDRRQVARGAGVPAERLVQDLAAAINQVDVVDLVTPTTSHFELCRQALEAGKDVFVEKPMALTSDEARQLVELADRSRCLIQVGFSYRYHPAAQRLKAEIQRGTLGPLRYLSGAFMGFKRARTDVGVMHTDGIHFLDLFNWWLDCSPTQVYAVCKDHFGRGLDDLSIALLTYPAGTVAKVESGYLQPGRWNDRVVPGAMTTKEVTVVGEQATAEIDFEAATVILHDIHHECRNGIWVPILNGSTPIAVESCDPIQMICRELAAFLEAVQTRHPPLPGPVESGVNLAVLMECLYESSRRGEAMAVEGLSPARSE